MLDCVVCYERSLGGDCERFGETADVHLEADVCFLSEEYRHTLGDRRKAREFSTDPVLTY